MFTGLVRGLHDAGWEPLWRAFEETGLILSFHVVVFGGGGSQTAFGARAGASVLTRATTVLGVLFMLGALMLAILGQRGPGSLLSGADVPAPASAPAVPTPPVEQPK